MGRRTSLLVLAGGALAAVLLTSCDGGSHGAMMGGLMGGGSALPARYRSNGERIYFTGASESGTPITYTGGNMHLRMMGGGCATCHGTDKSGARMMPEIWLEAPPLTRAVLFGDHDDGHGNHASYDANTLHRAISRGLDPDGAELSPTMPRWSMSHADWRDLLAYLSQ